VSSAIAADMPSARASNDWDATSNRFGGARSSIARIPSLARSPRRDGASDPMPPIWMAIEEKFAKPQRA